MSSSIETLVNREYAYGFVTDVETDTLPPGLSEAVIGLISAKKEEPTWLLEWRLRAYKRWLTMKEPHWPNVKYGPLDYQSQSYYSAPRSVKPLQSLDDVDPELLRTYEKLGIPLDERKALLGIEEEGQTPVAVDAVFDSVSVATTMNPEFVPEAGRMNVCTKSDPTKSRLKMGSMSSTRSRFAQQVTEVDVEKVFSNSFTIANWIVTVSGICVSKFCVQGTTVSSVSVNGSVGSTLGV